MTLPRTSANRRRRAVMLLLAALVVAALVVAGVVLWRIQDGAGVRVDSRAPITEGSAVQSPSPRAIAASDDARGLAFDRGDLDWPAFLTVVKDGDRDRVVARSLRRAGEGWSLSRDSDAAHVGAVRVERGVVAVLWVDGWLTVHGEATGALRWQRRLDPPKRDDEWFPSRIESMRVISADAIAVAASSSAWRVITAADATRVDRACSGLSAVRAASGVDLISDHCSGADGDISVARRVSPAGEVGPARRFAGDLVGARVVGTPSGDLVSVDLTGRISSLDSGGHADDDTRTPRSLDFTALWDATDAGLLITYSAAGRGSNRDKDIARVSTTGHPVWMSDLPTDVTEDLPVLDHRTVWTVRETRPGGDGVSCTLVARDWSDGHVEATRQLDAVADDPKRDPDCPYVYGVAGGHVLLSRLAAVDNPAYDRPSIARLIVL